MSNERDPQTIADRLAAGETMQQVGESLGISRQRVSAILKKAEIKIPGISKRGQFTGKKGLGDNDSAITFRFPPEVAAALRDMGEERANFVRAAVEEKLKREGLLGEP